MCRMPLGRGATHPKRMHHGGPEPRPSDCTISLVPQGHLSPQLSVAAAHVRRARFQPGSTAMTVCSVHKSFSFPTRGNPTKLTM